MKKLPHEFEADTKVVPEVKIIQHVYHVVCSVLVLRPEMVQDTYFDQSLMMEPLLVPYDFDGHVLVRAMVQSPYHLSETALSYHFEDFVPVAYVVVGHLKPIEYSSSERKLK